MFRKRFDIQESNEKQGNIPANQELWGFYNNYSVDVTSAPENGNYKMKFQKSGSVAISMRDNGTTLKIQIDLPGFDNVTIILGR